MSENSSVVEFGSTSAASGQYIPPSISAQLATSSLGQLSLAIDSSLSVAQSNAQMIHPLIIDQAELSAEQRLQL